MKHFAALGWLALAASFAPAGDSLKVARRALLRGNYAEARETYEALLKNPKMSVAATLGISRAHQGEGQYEKALSVVDQALSASAKNADLLARRAEVLYLRGDWEA